jgi:transcriptional regulator with XRE-family HTH domain
LKQARERRGWTQEQAAAELEPYLGTRWTKAQFSSAERSVDGKRIRQFDADEIAAFVACFDLPPSYFLLPPEPTNRELMELVAREAAETVNRLRGAADALDEMAQATRHAVTKSAAKTLAKHLNPKEEDDG